MTKKFSFFSKDIICVMLATFFYQFSIQAVNPLMNGYARNLGISSTFAGIIVGVMSITSMILRPFAGNLTDRVSKYRLSLIGGILCAVGDFGYLFSANASSLLFFRIINGAGFVLCTVCLATWMAYLVPRQHLGAAMGYYGLLNALAMAIAPALAISIYQLLGYKFIITLAGVSAVAMVVVIQLIDNHAKPSVKLEDQHFKIIQRDALPVAIIFSLLSIPYFVTQADIVMYVQERHLNITVSLFFICYSIALIIIRILLKNYFDTISFGTWFFLCIIATIGYIILLTIMQNNFEMILAAVLMAVGFGIMVSVSQSTSLLLAPLEEQGLANATYYLGSDIGMSVGPIIGGILPTIFPLKFFYPAMLLLIPLTAIIYLFNRNKLNAAVQYN
ncbi:MFS transporter [Companilactobacillus ginsenosidimutans]|uniref:MFS transporter permease n=1 Tax=Companilactobacillus ginsenosidimutans TaxID=1007676 RepID=A0A0H4R2H7_9LACO|nr:MFS transporter [Companilactobacillus ginsenosidimutans]AKP67930.1 MFS transporter permease [Companilactobacillus ginsenosidimutans]